ncbi:formylmethanofuran dehydrogenase subunit E family protein [Methanoregula sp. PtaB.Bin085]|uniref:formylmethanofuran dehydrogenase subunit E family protein n=1 Tax=Methanoregula sp. PtaB.Bin085 TaxID=1811680 RepID=UPI0009C7BF6E|nr:formylmethanofuran dehydrogenase subunit E family protein [Methanoregula sp. PtaB.Bin085]OPX64786.1 MAG: FmdE, Molybdenum formylmethanofuran dehydrogenase operon [Methanoregula sp. PtaB.Bin085]
MQAGHHECSPEALKAGMKKAGIKPDLQEQILRLSEFHTYPAPGVLIGAFMVDLALELLGVSMDRKLYAICETPKCLPDALQILARCTTGNNRLRVVPIGKFAITLNTPTESETADAVRVYVDLQKLKKFPTIDLWYANSPAYDRHTMKGRLRDEIFRAGRDILSFENVRVPVIKKKKWTSVTCPCCWETVPDYLFQGDRCGACGSMRYYKRI